MLATKKDKIMAGIIVFFVLLAFILLGWMSKIGGFEILADVVQNPQLLTQ